MDPRVVELQKTAAELPGTIGLAGGLPAVELMPKDELARAVAGSDDAALQYGWAEGELSLRTWIASRLYHRGADVDASRVIVTAGAQQALAIAGELLRGRTIAVGEATYSAALDAFRHAGADVAVTGGDARYVIPGVANPHGIALPDPPLDGTPLVVDEAYVELRFDGAVPRPLVAIAPEHVWHVGTVSKTLSPGLRVGWLVPPPRHHAAAIAIKQASDLQTASLSQVALVRALGEIDYDAIVSRARREYARRAGALVEALRRVPGIGFHEPEGGLSIWVELPDRGDELALARTALAHGVMFDPGCSFRPLPTEQVAVRLSFAAQPPELLVEGARRFARALAAWRTA